MSNWTHVAGVIRIDDLRMDGSDVIDFDNLLGKELHYIDGWDAWDEMNENPERFMPCGSEGSLQKHVWVNPDASCLAAYTVSIFGDLRNHDSTDDIIEWFKSKCNEINETYIVRQATITVSNECNGQKSWTFVDQTE